MTGVVLLAGCLTAQTGCRLMNWGTFRADDPAAPTVNGSDPLSRGSRLGQAVPGQHHLRVSQYVFYTDRKLDPALPMFEELSNLREQVYQELRLPPAETIIQVFLFDDQKDYESYIKRRYNLPMRRAFFIAQPRVGGGPDDLLVFTYWGEHIREDLRHELTHALLHSTLPDVPLWLDEGLAEYFEVPPEYDGINPPHLDELKHQVFRPDLARLEQLKDIEEMKQPEYREAWAWVHLMLRGSPEAREVLLEYIRDLRRISGKQTNDKLLPRLREVFPDPDATLSGYIAAVRVPTQHLTRSSRAPR